MPALKPCPFCESEAVEYQDYRHSVNCNSCGAFGPDHDGLTPEIKMENCIEAWNERAKIMVPCPLHVSMGVECNLGLNMQCSDKPCMVSAQHQ